MPGLRDKIIINDGLDDSNHNIIKGYAKGIQARIGTLQMLAEELSDDALKKAQPIKADLEPACKEFNEAQEALCKAARKYIGAIDSTIARTAKLIDDELGLNTP